MWKPGGRENVRGQVDTTAPDGVREFLGGIIGPFPDFVFKVVENDGPGRPRRRPLGGAGTFTGTPFQGVEPTGARLDLEGIDVLIVRDGVIVENNAFADGDDASRASSA